MSSSEEKGKTRYQGKRFVCLVRQSSDVDGTTSTEAQLKLLYDWGNKRGMVPAGGDVVLNGVTGSLPALRIDLSDLFERRRLHNDFDVLLVQKLDRLTRSGSDHGFWIQFECIRRGITLIAVNDNLPDDDGYSNLIKVAMFETGRTQARSISERSVQGWMLAVAQGRNCVSSRNPFGCDRLYRSPEGVPLFIIRSLGDGRQQKLHPETREVIDTYGQVGGGSKGHYRKQKSERVELVPGNPVHAKAVHRIFDLHYNQIWGGIRIADLLNSEGVKSPTLQAWGQHQVESIYRNPVYTGYALGQKMSQGIYFRRGESQPEEHDYDATVLANCNSAPKQLRPPEEWRWQEQSAMKDFLPRPLAEKALAEIKKFLTERWERSEDPTLPKHSTSKHKASEYVLTDLLFAKQDGGPLTGVLCGDADHRTRYYRHRRGRVGYRKGSVYNKVIQAGPLEDAVHQLVFSEIGKSPDLKQRVLEAVAANPPSPTAAQDLERLRQQRGQVKAKIELIYQNLTDATLAEGNAVIDRMGNQRLELDRQIAELEGSVAQAQEDPDVLVDRVVATVQQLTQNMGNLSVAARRDLLKAFVERVEVDLETKDAEVWLIIPAGALETGFDAMRLASNSPCPAICQTHALPPIRLAFAECRYELVSSHVCYRCRRSECAA